MEPSEAYKYHPVTGNKLVKKGKNVLIDRITGKSFYISPIPGCAAIIVKDNKQILMVKRAREPHKGTWDLPGGFVEPYGTLGETLRS